MANSNSSVGINLGRVVVGGVVAGIILAVFGFIVMFVAQQSWGSALSGVERAQSPFPTAFTTGGIVLDLIFGLWSVWLYGSIRPRYGAGPVTAIVAGFAAWLMIGISAVAFCVLGNLQLQPTVMSVVVFLIPTLVAVVAGCSLYSEEEPRVAQPRRTAPTAKPAAPPKPKPAVAAPSGATVPPVKPTSPSVTVPPVSSPSPPAPSPPPPPAAEPPVRPAPEPVPSPPVEAPAVESASVEEKQAELQESMVAMELNDGVAVREVLRVFGSGGMPVEQIIEQLELVRWNFGEVHPRVVVTNALKELLANGKVKETPDGKWEFSR